jgi:hypothetical protein
VLPQPSCPSWATTTTVSYVTSSTGLTSSTTYQPIEQLLPSSTSPSSSLRRQSGSYMPTAFDYAAPSDTLFW